MIPIPPARRTRSVAGQFLDFWRGRHTYDGTDRPHTGWYLALWALAAATGLAAAVVAGIVSQIVSGSTPSNEVANLVTTASVGEILLTAVVIAPLWEETAFRLAVSRRPWMVGAGIAVLVLVGLPGVLGISPVGFVPPSWWRPARIVILVAEFVAAAGGITWWRVRRRERGVGAASSQRWMFAGAVVTTSLFSLAHLSNFSEFTALTPAMVLPQLFVGAVLVFARVTRGWWMGVALHAWNNLLLVGIAVSLRGASQEFQALGNLGFLALMAAAWVAAAAALAVNASRTVDPRLPFGPGAGPLPAPSPPHG